MAIEFVIPGPLRELASNRDRVRLRGSAESVNEALAMLWREHPALRDRVNVPTVPSSKTSNVFASDAAAFAVHRCRRYAADKPYVRRSDA